MKTTAAIVALFAATAQGFQTPPGAQRATTRLSLLAPEQTESLFTQATECVESGCAVEDVDDLIVVLKEQQKDLYDRVQEIKKMVAALETMNEKDDRQVDEVRETVRALYRVFQLGDKASGNDYPALSKPTGYSGDVGDGPKTAYDALPPKPYKP